MSKLTPAQQEMIDTIARDGYLEEDRANKNVRARLYEQGLIAYKSISVVARIDRNRMTMGRVNIDAYVLTEKGKQYATDSKQPAAPAGER